MIEKPGVCLSSGLFQTEKIKKPKPTAYAEGGLWHISIRISPPKTTWTATHTNARELTASQSTLTGFPKTNQPCNKTGEAILRRK
jgi:hypothetical protein